MRPSPRRWVVAVISVTVLAAACSSDDDEPAASTSPESPSTSATSAPDASSPDAEEVRQRTLDVIAGVPGEWTLEPAEEDCLVDAVIDDGELRDAVLADDTEFTDLPADVQGRAVDLVVDCAPAAVARTTIDTVGLDVDEAARTCLEDGLATDPQLLKGLAAVAIGADGGAVPDDVPAGLILDLLGLVEECGVPLSALMDGAGSGLSGEG